METKRTGPVERKFEWLQSIHHRQIECKTYGNRAERRTELCRRCACMLRGLLKKWEDANDVGEVKWSSKQILADNLP